MKRTKVLIVGTGFSGYTVHKEFSKKNIDHIIIEGGRVETAVRSSEQPYYFTEINNSLYLGPNRLKASNILDPSFSDRKYTIGGSSECWSGFIKPFEKSSFRNRYEDQLKASWGDVDFSYYNEEAAKMLNSPITNFDPEINAKKLGIKLPTLPEGFTYTLYSWAEEPLRLKNYFKKKIARSIDKISSNQNVLNSTRLEDIIFENNIAKKALVSDPSGKTFSIEFDSIYICTGGIQNALFAKKISENSSSPVKPISLQSNFQEHPLFGTYDLINHNLPHYFKKFYVKPSQLEKGRPGGFLQFAVVGWEGVGTPKVSFICGANHSRKPNSLRSAKNFIRSTIKGETPLELKIICEQRPTANSKIDFTDCEKTSLNWNIDPKDYLIYNDLFKKYAYFLSSSNFGEVRLKNDSIDGSFSPEYILGCAHHMGTVRYSASGETYVNENSQVIGAENIFILGSSMFPTSGFENPTHAIICSVLKSLRNSST